MSYLHVIASLDPAAGGTTEGLRALCDAAGRSGSACEVATIDSPDAPWRDSFPCPTHRLGPGRLGNYGYTRRLDAWLQTHAPRFDAVLVHGLWQYHGLAVRRALRAARRPYFVFTHGMLDPWFKREYPLKHLKKSLYWPWGDYRVLRDARAVLFTCEEERRQAHLSFGLYRANEAVVSFGTPGPSGDSAAALAAFYRRFPELRDKHLLLFLGRVHPKKGCDLLVQAFAAIAGRNPSLHLVMAGPDPGNWRPDLRRVLDAADLGRRVTWAGMLTGELKWGALRAADAFVLPSHQENFGIAVVEAMACAVPVLISNKVNIWREIAADEAGLVADDTLEGTTALLEGWLATDNAKRLRLGRNAVRSFRNRFHIDVAWRNLLTVLENGPGLAPQHSAA